jgi:hypothetical protein
VSTWSDLLAWADVHGGGKYLFRGQGCKSSIIPKIGRKEYRYSVARERELFSAFKGRARPFLGVAVTSDWEWLALAQHHGAPTRLSDWTTSSLVAAWFAVSSFPIETDACIYALDIDGKRLGGRIDPASGQCSTGAKYDHPFDPLDGHFLLETSPVSARITTQRGLFLLHGKPKSPLPIAASHQFTIPKAERSDIMQKLAGFGVEASQIFPDLDGLCKSLDWRMKLGIPFGLI